MTTHQQLKSIEQDFGQPFRDVVAGFAQDGREPESIAKILEVPESVIRKRCPSRLFAKPIERKGAPVHQPEYKERTGPPGERVVTEKWKKALSENGKKNKGNGRKITYRGVLDTISGHCERHGVNEKTARNRYRRYPDNLDWVFYPGNHNERKRAE